MTVGGVRQVGALLCDVDGVLRHWDPDLAPTLEREHGLPPGTIAATAFAPARLEPAITGRVSDAEWRAEVTEELAARCGSPTTARQVMAAWGDPLASRVDTDVLRLLAAVRARVPVALVSNGSTRLEDDLDLLGVTRAVDGLVVVNSARVGTAKPHAAIYHHAAARLGVPVERCLFVDDTAGHVAAACALGMRGHHYLGVDGLRRELAAALPD